MSTLPRLFMRAVQKYGKRVALRDKDYGIWREISWQEYYENAKSFCLGMISLGLENGDKVSVLSENRPEWLYADIAVQAAGAITVGIYPESVSEEVEYIIAHSESKYVVVEDQEQADKVLDIVDNLPNLRKIIVCDMRGMRNYKHSLIISFPEVQGIGKEYTNNHSAFFEELVEKTNPTDVAIIAYTSGTTGKPKGVMLTHQGIIAISDAILSVDPMFEKDENVSYLPFPWVGERMFSLFFPLKAGFIVNFPENIEMDVVLDNMREICPSILFAVPRVWEDLCSSVFIRMDNATFFKRICFKLAMPVGHKVANMQAFGKEVPWYLKMLFGITNFAVFAPLRRQLGLSHIRIAYTGGAAIGPEVFKFFHAIGVKLRQVYGQTEICGIGFLHVGNEVRPDTVGPPLPGIDVRISEDDEVLVKGEPLFKGYYKNEEATNSALRDGWLYTGDQGYIDDNGHLVILDRKKDVISTKTGVELSPQLIENKLKFSPYVKEAITIGQNRPFVSCLVQIDLENVGNWAQKRSIPYTTFKDLSQKEEVYQLIQKEISRVNKDLEDEAQIKRFVLLDKELDPDDEEITRTKKVRRNIIESKFSEMIKEMYVEKEHILTGESGGYEHTVNGGGRTWKA